MRYFFDTEFIENGRTIDLISIGIVCEDGRELYAVSREARLDLAPPWVRAHVLPQLPPYGDPAWMTRWQIRMLVAGFVKGVVINGVVHGERPEFWAYYADYDWVALCQLFGTMMDLPTHWPKYCMDLKQMSKMRGDPPNPAKSPLEHNALEDARWNRLLYDHLCSKPSPDLPMESR